MYFLYRPKTLFLLALVMLFVSYTAHAQQGKNKLNPNLEFRGDHILYKGKKINLGPQALYIDGQLTDAEAAKQPYVFNSVNEAAKHLANGTEASPMVLYIAPWVYWIDNPD